MVESLPEGITILFIEHDMDTAFRLAKRILVLSSGSVLTMGSPEEVKNDIQVQKIYLGAEQ